MVRLLAHELLKIFYGGTKMARILSDETRVVMMSANLMKLYDLRSFDSGHDFSPITFYNPQECLSMMVDADSEEAIIPEVEPVVEKALRVEKQWGELELRLSFFSKALNWQ
jgi:hypothetical protein